MIEIRDDFRSGRKDAELFELIMDLKGEVYREHKGRRTFRVERDGKGYFIKVHRGVGWKEIFKNFAQLKFPVLGAHNEIRAIRRLEELGIPTVRMVGYGARGLSPAGKDSFIICEELEDAISLEDYCQDWAVSTPDVRLKRVIINKVAEIARRLHRNGLNHRDFYICHFFLHLKSLDREHNYDAVQLSLIDLHRVQIREKTPERWLVKDISGLLFSSMNIGLTQRDMFRFMKSYCEKPLYEILKTEGPFWNRVRRRATRLYEKHLSAPRGVD